MVAIGCYRFSCCNREGSYINFIKHTHVPWSKKQNTKEQTNQTTTSREVSSSNNCNNWSSESSDLTCHPAIKHWAQRIIKTKGLRQVILLCLPHVLWTVEILFIYRFIINWWNILTYIALHLLVLFLYEIVVWNSSYIDMFFQGVPENSRKCTIFYQDLVHVNLRIQVLYHKLLAGVSHLKNITSKKTHIEYPPGNYHMDVSKNRGKTPKMDGL